MTGIQAFRAARRYPRFLPIAGGMALALMATAAAGADGPVDPEDFVVQSVIGGGPAGRGGNTGVVAVNVAAGEQNFQVNAAALALNDRGASTARITTQQGIYSDSGTPSQVAMARIENGAFAGSVGLISINQASGEGNAQANGIIFALGVEGEVIADSVLAQTTPQAGSSTGSRVSPDNFREASIAEGAFRNVNGLAQVNQSAGSGNATANNFVLQLDTKL